MARFRGGLEWRHFVRWCKLRGLRPLPAHPWTLGAYVRACERRFPKGAMPGRIQAIAKAHVLQGYSPPDRHPTVTRTLRSIQEGEQQRRQGSDLFSADIADRTPQAPKGGNGKDETAAERKRRSLRHVPPLVSRRPSKE